MSEVLPEAGEPDVNTDEGFSAALRGLIPEAPVEETGQAEVAEPEESAQPVEAEGAALEEETTPETEPVVDPTITDWLSKHGGDTNAALAAALKEKAEAQSLIGKQGNELGTLREQVAKIEGRLEAQPQAAPPPLPTQTSEEVEALGELISDHGGRNAMAWVVENRPDLIDVTLDQWGITEPVEAARFAARMEALQIAEAHKQEPNEYVERMQRQEQLGKTLDTVRSRWSAEEWSAIEPYIVPVLEAEDTPLLLKKAVVSDDERERLEGVQILTEWAIKRARTEATATAVAQRTEQVRDMKQAAAVATGSQRPVAPREPSAGEPNENIKTFYERLLEPDATSISVGLTTS